MNYKKYSYNKNLNNYVCQNCGLKGHTSRSCKEPRLSLGVISYKIDSNKKIKYLLICRRNTIGYVQFIRGQYIKNDIDYIQKLFNVMTNHEINIIKNNDFDYLWEYLWLDNFYTKNNDKIRKDKNIANNKFNNIKKGYIVNKNNINLNYFIKNKTNNYEEPEWGFPKGKRNINETNYQAALREFCEETGNEQSDIFISDTHPTFIEEYKSYDNIKYKNIYYLSEYISEKIEFSITPKQKEQFTEVSAIQFLTLEECLSKIRGYSIEKKNIIRNVDDFISKNL
jgi:hypothetical protein